MDGFRDFGLRYVVASESFWFVLASILITVVLMIYV